MVWFFHARMARVNREMRPCQPFVHFTVDETIFQRRMLKMGCVRWVNSFESGRKRRKSYDDKKTHFAQNFGTNKSDGKPFYYYYYTIIFSGGPGRVFLCAHNTHTHPTKFLLFEWFRSDAKTKTNYSRCDKISKLNRILSKQNVSPGLNVAQPKTNHFCFCPLLAPIWLFFVSVQTLTHTQYATYRKCFDWVETSSSIRPKMPKWKWKTI